MRSSASGGQVEVEAKARGRASLAFAERHVVEFVGGAGVVVIAVVRRTVDIDHFGHGEDLLEAVEDERAPLGLPLCLACRHMACRLRPFRSIATASGLVLAVSPLRLFTQEHVWP